MPKVKLSVKEMKRLSFILGKEIRASKATINNTSKQDFKLEDRKKVVEETQLEDLQFLETMKEKFDIETFGRNG